MADGSVKIDVGLDITKAERDLAKLKDKINKAERQLSSDTARKSELEREIEKAGQAADAAREKIKKLKEEYKNSRGSERASVKERLDAVTANYRDTVRDSDRLSREYQAVNERIDRSTQSLTEMREQAGAMTREIESARPGEALAKGFEYAKKKLWTFLKYAVGIRSVYILFRRLRSAIKDAVSSFAEHDAETKGTIDALKSSLEQLKMSWGAAFAPILNAVAPIIQKFIGWLTDAANAVSRFFAIMSGKSTYKRVVGFTEGVAEGYEDVADAADEAKKSVMGFDELNPLNAPNESGKGKSGGGKGSSAIIEDADVGEISPLMENLRKAVEDIKALFNGDISFKDFLDNLNAVEVAILALGGAAILGAIGKFTAKLLGLSGAGATFGIAAAKIATGALAVADAFLVAYDVSKLTEAAKTYHEAQEAHNNETETALESYRKLYEEKGKEVADQWAAMVYQIDTTNMSFEKAQQAITEKIETYWDGVPQNMWDGFKQGWDTYFGKDGKGLWQLFKDAFTNVIDWTKDLLGIHSPSTVFYDIAQQTGQGFLNGLRDKFSDIKSMLKGKLDEMKQLFNVTWSFPKITMPHFSWTWQQIGKYVSIPNISVSWYARGGVFDDPTMIGVGEAGKEAVVPLEKNTEWMRLVADGLMDRLEQAGFAQRMASAFASVPMPAMAGGSVVPPRISGGFSDYGIEDAVRRGVSDAFNIAMNAGQYEEVQPINVYIGGEKIDSYLAKRERRKNLISGGR